MFKIELYFIIRLKWGMCQGVRGIFLKINYKF